MDCPVATRELCLRCLCASTACYCARVRAVEARTRFVLLRHPRERRKQIGTARMAYLSLPGSLLIDGLEFSGHPGIQGILDDPSLFPVVLFPGTEAVELGGGTPVGEWLPPGRRLLVFVIDGTWPMAKKLLRVNPPLAALPRICFTPERPSEYLIRRQPSPECVSTIEAIHQVLRWIEPEVDATPLLDVFRWRMTRQAAFSSVDRPDSYRKAPCLPD